MISSHFILDWSDINDPFFCLVDVITVALIVCNHLIFWVFLHYR